MENLKAETENGELKDDASTGSATGVVFGW